MSFDGIAQDCRAAGTRQHVERCIRRLADLSPAWFAKRLRIAITLSPANVATAADSVEACLSLGAREVSIAAVSGLAWPPPATLEALLDEQLGRIVACCAAHRSDGWQSSVALLREPPTIPPSEDRAPWCAAGSSRSFAVDPAGTAWGCAAYADSIQRLYPGARDAARALRLGDVLDPSLPGRLGELPERTRGVRALTYRRAKRTALAECETCSELASCLPCPAAASREPGNLDPDVLSAAPCALTRAAGRARRALRPRPDSLPSALSGLRDRLDAIVAGLPRDAPTEDRAST